MSLLIKNGTVVTSNNEFQGDIYIEDGKFKEIGSKLDVKADETVDASGKYVFPGGVNE